MGPPCTSLPDTHLAQDPVLRRLIEDYGGPLPLEHDSAGRPSDGRVRSLRMLSIPSLVAEPILNSAQRKKQVGVC